jgi:hypothetical protein
MDAIRRRTGQDSGHSSDLIGDSRSNLRLRATEVAALMLGGPDVTTLKLQPGSNNPGSNEPGSNEPGSDNQTKLGVALV